MEWNGKREIEKEKVVGFLDAVIQGGIVGQYLIQEMEYFHTDNTIMGKNGDGRVQIRCENIIEIYLKFTLFMMYRILSII